MSLTAPIFQNDPVLKACLAGTHIIKMGETSTISVKLIQQALINLGYALPVFGADGSYGNETISAVKKFQEDYAIPPRPDGIIGKNTMAALDQAAALLSVPVLHQPELSVFTNDKAIAFIKEAEGVRLTAYPDPATNGPPWTIGYGNTTYIDGNPVKPGDTITQEQANVLLLDMLNKKFIPGAKRVPNFDIMTPSQQAALISFTWNVGPNWYNNSNFQSLKNVLDNMQWEQVPAALYGFKRANGQINSSLTSRRVAEGFMWYGAKIKVYNAWSYEPAPVIDSTAPPTILPWPNGSIGAWQGITYDIDDYRSLPDWMINTTHSNGVIHDWTR
jgi:lysozyme